MSNQNEDQEQIIKYKQLIESKKYDSALEIIEGLLSIHSEDEELLNDKGIILTKLGEYDEALDSFEKALKISEKKETRCIIWNNKGLTYCNKKEFLQAIKCFEADDIFYDIKSNE